MKRIISGNDHWHCLPWLMATSQYLTSHHLHQSHSQWVMCGARTAEFICPQSDAWHAAICYRRVFVWRAAGECVTSTCHWVMCFMSHGLTWQPLCLTRTSPVASLPPFVILFPSFTQRGHVGPQHSRAKKSWIVCVCGDVKRWYHKSNGKYLCIYLARWDAVVNLFLPKWSLCVANTLKRTWSPSSSF